MHSLEEKLHLVQGLTVAFDCYIIDGNAAQQAMTSLPSTFGELAECVFDQLPRAQRVDFVTDSYHPCSIKGVKRSRRGSAKAHLVKGPSTKVPRDWKRFLCNEVNKRCLLNIHAVARDLGVDVNLALAALHAFTGCDTISTSARNGKVTPLKLLKKEPEFLPTFHALGTSVDVENSVFEDLEKFMCLMYGSKSADISYVDMRSLLRGSVRSQEWC